MTYLKWADIDAGNPREASERVLAALCGVPDYNWLFDILHPVLHSKYCENCQTYNPDVRCKDDGSSLFPYCFVKKDKTIKEQSDSEVK